jgi:hypothetical protein
MKGMLHCGFIAQLCSAIAPFSLKGVIYSQKSRPGVSGEVMTLSPRDTGTCSLCAIKGDGITFSDSRRPYRYTSMMPEPRRRGHMATATPRSVGSLSFFGWQQHLRPLLTRDPAVYATRQKSDLASDGSAPNLAPSQMTTPRPPSTI